MSPKFGVHFSRDGTEFASSVGSDHLLYLRTSPCGLNDCMTLLFEFLDASRILEGRVMQCAFSDYVARAVMIWTIVGGQATDCGWTIDQFGQRVRS
jgi:hypothetical protein